MSKTSLIIFITVFNKKSIQLHPIIMTDADYDYILDEIERREKTEFEWNVSGNSGEEYY